LWHTGSMTIKKKTTKKKTTAKKKTSKKKVVVAKKDKVKKQGPNAGEPLPETYVFGRPTKYKKEMCQIVVEKSKSNEFITRTDIAVHFDVGMDTLIEWEKTHPDFSKALKKSEAYRMQYMERMGLQGTHQGKTFNAVPWLFMTKNMFPKHYSDKKEIAVETSDEAKRSFGFNLSEDTDKIE